MLGKVYKEGCNWWCRRFTDLRDIAGGYISGGIIGAISETIGAFSRFDTSFSSSLLTFSDDRFLEKWYSFDFEPWLKSIIDATEKISSQLVFDKELLLKINSINQQICLVKGYYDLKTEISTDLSDKGISERKRYIDFVLQPIEHILNKKILEFPQGSVSSINNAYESILLQPVVREYLKNYPSFSCVDYILSKPMDIDFTLGDNNPIDLDIEMPDLAEQPAETKKSGFPWWLLIAGFVGYKILK